MIETQQTFFDSHFGVFQKPKSKSSPDTSSKAAKREPHSRLQAIRERYSESELRLIHVEAMQAVQSLHRCESNVIRKLQLVEKYLVHRIVGGHSLFKYAVSELRLTPDQAYMYINVARKAATLPLLQKAIDANEVSVSKVRKMVSVMTVENQQKWIDLAKTATKEEIEKEVAKVSPRASRGERKKRLSERLSEISFPISDESLRKFERVRNLMAQAKRKNVTFEEATELMCDFYLHHHDPVLKAERASQRKASAKKKMRMDHKGIGSSADHCRVTTLECGNDSVEFQTSALPLEKFRNVESKLDEHGRTIQASCLIEESRNGPAHNETWLEPSKSGRVHLPAQTRHAIHLRDQGRCQHSLNSTEVCGEERWIDLHHIIEVSKGGTNDPHNLVTLCRRHHELQH